MSLAVRDHRGVSSFRWQVTRSRRSRFAAHTIGNSLFNAHGTARAGELLAVIGESGCGKTTLLNALACKPGSHSDRVEANLSINDREATAMEVRRCSAYVEAENTFLGSLTVHETMDFTARLALPRNTTKQERLTRIKELLEDFKLTPQRDAHVGTPWRQGISTGEKRRLSIIMHLITHPMILFLDEPTSGLDAISAMQVVSYLRDTAKARRIIIIASIHQPSSEIFRLFDNLLLLSSEGMIWGGPISEIDIRTWREQDAKLLVGLVGPQFTSTADNAASRHYGYYAEQPRTRPAPDTAITTGEIGWSPTRRYSVVEHRDSPMMITTMWIQMHRAFIKAYRDVFVYTVRLVMYLGLATLMSTVWLRLRPSEDNVQAFVSAIFFGGAFMSFMAVAYIPAFLEDRAMFIKERSNRLCGPASFILANFLIGAPFLFLITVAFSTPVYWLSNFRPSATAFFTWIMWLFLDLLAAESLVVAVSLLFPAPVVALAITAFTNGIWMCTSGFLVPLRNLNSFWRYAFHYVDYQTYVFQGMMTNEFAFRNYTCERDEFESTDCSCRYHTHIESQCLTAGTGILEDYGFYRNRDTKTWVISLIAIVLVMRVSSYVILHFKRK